MSLRERLLANPPVFRRRMVEVPEWDAKLEVRSLSVDAKMSLGKLTESDSDPAGVMVHLLASCVFDPDSGEHVFTVADGEWIRQQDSAVVEEVATVALEVSGLKERALDGPKDDSSKTASTVTSSSGRSV